VSVTKRYYRGTINGAFQAFIIDVDVAYELAFDAGDEDGRDALHRIWLEYFEVHLGNMTAAKLIGFLETRQVWQQDGDWVVFKTVEEPCLAYTAQKDSNVSVTIIALGICYRYPQGGADSWWQQVIQPRVRSLS
jgi:hypothetical protein